MIENKQLYPFEEKNPSDEPPQIEPEFEPIASQGMERMLGRVVVSGLCLLLLFFVAKIPEPWAKWIKQQLHTAINMSAGQTFGRLFKSPVVNSIVVNGRNLIRLEEVTHRLMNQTQSGASPSFPQDSIWPLKGKIIRKFGWYQAAGSQKPQFSKGIQIAGVSDDSVMAIQRGTVAEVYQEAGSGWTLVLAHGNGYRSIYRNLGQVMVNISQIVYTGEKIAKLKPSGPKDNLLLFFELQEAGRPIDPSSVIAQN